MEFTMVFWVLIAVALTCLIRWLRSGEIKGIPEPAGNYMVGHVFRLGGNFAKTFHKWAEEVGAVYQLRFFKFRIVVFNDKESIAKICALPEASGRPRFGIFATSGELVGEGLATSEGPVWEEQRQFYQKALRKFGVGRAETERSLQDEIQEKLQEWQDLKMAPFELQNCAVAYVFNALWSVLGSQRWEAEKVIELTHQLGSIARLDTFGHKAASILPKIAGKFTNAVDEKLIGLVEGTKLSSAMFAKHQEDRLPNNPRDVIDHILDKMDATKNEKSIFHEKNLKTGFALHEIVTATIDTTAKTLEWFMLYLAQKPDVASKLSSEIDSVLGEDTDSCPGLSEREKMPYAQACILEALRLSSVIPLAVPHKALEDFEFNGSLIPKGTLLIMNLYGVHHDPQLWDQPEEFKPERFLTPEGDKIDLSVKNQMLPFGAGRRMCPGNVIAMDSMFLFVVNAFRKFSFELVDWDGNLKEVFGITQSPPAGVKLKAVARQN